jgi:hypothetical protein
MKKYAVKIYSNIYQNYVLPNMEIKQYQDDMTPGPDGEAMDKEEVQQTTKFIAWE